MPPLGMPAYIAPPSNVCLLSTSSSSPASLGNPPSRRLQRFRAVRSSLKGDAPENSTLSSQNPDFSVTVNAPSTVYRDSFFDLAFMHVCRQAFGKLAGWQSPRPWEENYLGMVEVSHALMRRRTAKQQQQAVLQGFPEVPPWFRALFPYRDWGAEANARITPAFFTWLVGPCSVDEVEIHAPPGQPGARPPPGGTHEEAGGGTSAGKGAASQTKVLRSAVKIEKCRYLETSGCVGMCVNLCKVPTQHFFTNELGMPLTMKPNFDDLSCQMIFGQEPPPLEEDPVLAQACFMTCPTGNPNAAACPKLT